MLRELSQMGEHFDIGILQHFKGFFDAGNSPLLPYTVLDCHLKNKETSEYRSAYGQLCDWLYGWNVASRNPLLANDSEPGREEGEPAELMTATGAPSNREPQAAGEAENSLQSIIETFKQQRSVRDIDLQNENEAYERDRIVKVFDTLLSITYRNLKRQQFQIEEELPRVGLGLASLQVNSGNDGRDAEGGKLANELWASGNADHEQDLSAPEKKPKSKKARAKAEGGSEKAVESDDGLVEDDSSTSDSHCSSDHESHDSDSPETEDGLKGSTDNAVKKKSGKKKNSSVRRKKVDDNVMVVKKRSTRQNHADAKEKVESHIGGFESNAAHDEAQVVPSEPLETSSAPVPQKVKAQTVAPAAIVMSNQNPPVIANLSKKLSADSLSEESAVEAVLSIVKDPVGLLLSDLHLVLQSVDHSTDYMLVSLSICLLLLGFAEWQKDEALYERLYTEMQQALSDFVKVVLRSLLQLLQKEITEVDPIISTLALALTPSNPKLNVAALDKQLVQKFEQDPFGMVTLAQTNRAVELLDIADVFLLRQRLRHMGTLRVRWSELLKSPTLANAANIGGPIRDAKLKDFAWTRMWRKLDLVQTLAKALDIHMFPPLVAAHQSRRYVLPQMLHSMVSPVMPMTNELQAGKGSLVPLPGPLSKVFLDNLVSFCYQIVDGGNNALEKPLQLFRGLMSSDSLAADSFFRGGKMEHASVRAFRPSIYDADLWLSGGDDGCVRIHDLRSQQCIGQFIGHKSIVTGVSFIDSLDTRIVSCSLDRTLKIWNSQGAFCERTLQGHTEMVLTCDARKESGYIASGSADNTVRIWDSNSGLPVATLSRHIDWVKVVKFSKDGRYLLSAGLDDTVCVWDIKVISHSRNPNVSSPFKAFKPFSQQILHLSLGSETEVAISSRQGCIKFFNYITGQETSPEIVLYPSWACTISFSPGGQYLAAAGLDNTISIYEVATAKRLRLLRVVNNGITALEWIRDIKVSKKLSKKLGNVEVIGVEWLIIGTLEGFIQKILL